MSLITIRIDDIGRYVDWLHQACRDKYVRINDQIGIRFRGDAWPRCEWRTNCAVITWYDGAEVDIPGIADPTIERIVVFASVAEIELAYAPDVKLVWERQ